MIFCEGGLYGGKIGNGIGWNQAIGMEYSVLGKGFVYRNWDHWGQNQ